MSCDFNARIVSGRGYAQLLSNMWKTWTSYDELDCDVQRSKFIPIPFGTLTLSSS